jgi:hypothetical protein
MPANRRLMMMMVKRTGDAARNRRLTMTAREGAAPPWRHADD